jgi:hypothetical protein
LDITKVTFHRRDRAVVVANFEFMSDRRGAVSVFVKARHGSNVRMVSQHGSRSDVDYAPEGPGGSLRVTDRFARG